MENNDQELTEAEKSALLRMSLEEVRRLILAFDDDGQMGGGA